MSEEFDLTGSDPVNDPPAAPRKKRGRKPKDSGNGAERQMPAKSHLKLVEDLKVGADCQYPRHAAGIWRA
jgi:hypothetical protein